MLPYYFCILLYGTIIIVYTNILFYLALRYTYCFYFCSYCSMCFCFVQLYITFIQNKCLILRVCLLNRVVVGGLLLPIPRVIVSRVPGATPQQALLLKHTIPGTMLFSATVITSVIRSDHTASALHLQYSKIQFPAIHVRPFQNIQISLPTMAPNYYDTYRY